MASGGPDTAALLAWCVRHGIAVDERLSIEHVPLDAHEDSDLEYQAEGGAIAVVANAPIPAGDTVVYIPCDAVLSTKTSTLAHSSEFQEALRLCADNALHLALCLAYERGLEDKSAFAGYVQSLPRRVNLPMCWDASYEGTRWIQSTEAARSVARAAQFWDSDASTSKPGYSLTHGKGVVRKTQQAQVDWPSYVDAFTLVSSRAFVINVYHGLCMVPIADLFNHTDMHNVQVEAEELVCLQCGYPHQGPCTQALSNTIDVRCIEALYEGDEAINTYGDLSNAELLCQYGFVLDSKTLYDRSSWGPAMPAELRELEEAFSSCLAYTPNGNHAPGLDHLLLSLEPEAASDDALFARLQSPRDFSRPLFVDPTGRPSYVLWRLCLGAAMACAAAPITDWPMLLNQVQSFGGAMQAAPDHAVHLAAQCLAHLCTSRMKNLYVTTHDDEAGALLQADRGPLRSTVQLALQESDTLHRARAWAQST